MRDGEEESHLAHNQEIASSNLALATKLTLQRRANHVKSLETFVV